MTTRLLVVSPIHPHPGHSTRAANVVTFELVRALASQEGIAVGFLKVDRAEDEPASPVEREGLGKLAQAGVDVRPSLRLPPAPARRLLPRRILSPDIADHYPEVGHRALLNEAVEAFRADVVLVPWSEWVTALCAEAPARRFAYYGNPDHKVALLRAQYDRRHGGAALSLLKSRVHARLLRKVHLDLMRNYDWMGNVADNDARFYAENGHPNSFYIPNIWIDRFGPGWLDRREALERGDPAPIVGNVGKLFGTANRYGLELLGTGILPALRRRARPGSYEMQILGSGKMPGELASLFGAPDTKVCGFVPDIDEAILAAPIFLCANNGSEFKVGHTRYLHAWTLGACVVAHRDAALSMPEIVHGENALLGGDSEEIAELVVQALADRPLRRRLGQAGYETYRSRFTPDTVAGIIARHVGMKTGVGSALASAS